MQVKPKKSLGQNFLIDNNIIEKISSITEVTNKEILEVGNSRDLMESFKAFRGQEPDTSALLKRRGLTATVE